MDQTFCEVENTDPTVHQRWLDKHDLQPDEDGGFRVDKVKGKTPVEDEQLFDNIKVNLSSGDYTALSGNIYDPRTFVMVCAGPSLADHLDEIRAKALDPDQYLVVCSNMTGAYLLENGITPHVNFVLDPQAKKQYDIAPGKTSPTTQYWIGVCCHPSVMDVLREQDITPYVFLADFEAEGRAQTAVREALGKDSKTSIMAIQGGTMAGLRAINLAEALGFRKMEYYGFDATVRVGNGVAQPYAYEKKRGEAIIDVKCDQCGEKFDTTLVFQRQVNEFLEWSRRMPWLDIKVIGGGLIAHCQQHAKELTKPKATHRYTEEYARLQHSLHDKGGYGVSGQYHIPTIFHAVAQLAKRLGPVDVLDYGSAHGNTMIAVRHHMWMPPSVTDHCYDPFVFEHAIEPKPADLVICTDVMEHVEPECVYAVLDHISSLTKRIVFFSISMRESKKVMEDGRNAHINIRDAEFWMREIQTRFIMSEAKVNKEKSELLVVAQALSDVKDRLSVEQ